MVSDLLPNPPPINGGGKGGDQKGIIKMSRVIKYLCFCCFITSLFLIFSLSFSQPQSSDEYYKSAEQFFNEHTYKRAYENYDKFISSASEKDERAPLAMNNSLICLYKLNQYSDAEKKAKAIIEKYKDTIWEAKAHYILANIYVSVVLSQSYF